MRLMDYLLHSEDLKTEGVFRKTGYVLRQRDLRRRILSSSRIEFPLEPQSSVGRRKNGVAAHQPDEATATSTRDPESSPFSIHDYAATLKNVLRDMPQLILTHELLPIFSSVASLTLGNMNETGERVPLSQADHQVAVAKQLKAIRVLRFMLPTKNQQLLRRVLDLLSKTLEFSHFNRLSAESLGTLFGPLLLAPINVGLSFKCSSIN